MYRNQQKVEPSGNRKKWIVIENNVTPLTRIITILSGPTLLIGFFVTIFVGGLNEHPFSLDHIKAFLPIAGPFAFFISYKFWKVMGTKVILTDQKVIKKTPRGKELHLNWSEIKRINIIKIAETNSHHFTFSRKNTIVPFANASRIFCPPGALLSRTKLSEEAINFIFNKINLYKIPVKVPGGLFEEIFNISGNSLKGQGRPLIQNPAARKRSRARPSSTQTPTPK